MAKLLLGSGQPCNVHELIELLEVVITSNPKRADYQVYMRVEASSEASACQVQYDDDNESVVII